MYFIMFYMFASGAIALRGSFFKPTGNHESTCAEDNKIHHLDVLFPGAENLSSLATQHSSRIKGYIYPKEGWQRSLTLIDSRQKEIGIFFASMKDKLQSLESSKKCAQFNLKSKIDGYKGTGYKSTREFYRECAERHEREYMEAEDKIAECKKEIEQEVLLWILIKGNEATWYKGSKQIFQEELRHCYSSALIIGECAVFDKIFKDPNNIITIPSLNDWPKPEDFEVFKEGQTIKASIKDGKIEEEISDRVYPGKEYFVTPSKEDGTDIGYIVTLPQKGNKPFPSVAWIHGGPMCVDTLNNPEPLEPVF